MRNLPIVITTAAGLVLLSAMGCSPRDRDDVSSATRNAATEVRQSTASAADKAERVIDDTMITTKVKSALLADDTVKGLTIEVDTVQGTVTLTGTAKSSAERAKAESLASGIDGVRTVVNRISVS